MPALRAPIASSGVGAIAAGPAVSRRCRRMAISSAPQASNTSTSQGPMVAAPITPSTTYTTQRTREQRPLSLARRQLAGSRLVPACTATAATADPAPAPAARTVRGGAPWRNSAASARMRIRPGMMNAAPPSNAPGRPRTRQAQKIAS